MSIVILNIINHLLLQWLRHSQYNKCLKLTNTINEKLGEVLAGTQSLKSGETELITGIDTILTKLNGIDVNSIVKKIAKQEKIKVVV